MVIDEIIEGRVTREAGPWPMVDPQTLFLSFDLTRTTRMTFEATDLHRVVSKVRAVSEPETTASRPLRIGDVFEVVAGELPDLKTWKSLVRMPALPTGGPEA